MKNPKKMNAKTAKSTETSCWGPVGALGSVEIAPSSNHFGPGVSKKAATAKPMCSRAPEELKLGNEPSHKKGII